MKPTVSQKDYKQQEVNLNWNWEGYVKITGNIGIGFEENHNRNP